MSGQNVTKRLHVVCDVGHWALGLGRGVLREVILVGW